MANFIEYASMAQEELNREKNVLSEKEKQLQEKASLLAGREADLDKKQSEIVLQNQELLEKIDKLTTWESKKLKEEEVQKIADESSYKLKLANDKLKLAEEKLNEAKMILEEQAKRELALSEMQKTYREDIKKEVMDKFLGF